MAETTSRKVIPPYATPAGLQLFFSAAMGFASAIALRGVLSPDESAAILGAGAMLAWLAIVVTAPAAVWVLVGLVTYALPLPHALYLARAARQYVDEPRLGGQAD